MCPFLFAENYISRELLSVPKRVNGNKFERMDNMNKEIREYDKNVQFEIGQRIQEITLHSKGTQIFQMRLKLEIGQRIQEMRLDKNMKSIELATELGITRNQMSRIENGRANCTISQLFILLQILGGSADYILFGKKYEREIKITKEQKEVLINLINAFNE